MCMGKTKGLSRSRSRAMEEAGTPLREHRRQVRKGEVRLTPRKVGLLQCQTEPESITGPILSALRKGCGPKAAAGEAGCTLDELKYMVFLGEAGHKAYEVFFEEYNRARAAPVARLELVRHERALAAAWEENMASAGAADVQAALESADPESYCPAAKVERREEREGGLKVTVNNRYELPRGALPPGGGVMPEVVDAEVLEDGD